MTKRKRSAGGRRPMGLGRAPPRSELRLQRTSTFSEPPLDPRRWLQTLLWIIDGHNHRHATKAKGVSFKTIYDRRKFLVSLFRMLRKEGYRMDPRSLGGRHVEHAMRLWIGRGLKPATIQTNLSMVRVFATWIGKPGSMVKPAEDYVEDPKLVKRRYAASADRSWVSAGVSAEAVRDKAREIDPRVAAALMLMRAFGLRVKEAYMLRPHLAVLESDLTLVQSDAWSVDDYLAVVRGTKGGRKRVVPIDTTEKREAVEYAKSLTRSSEESVAGPSRSLAQVKRRHYYVMELLGLTRADLGVTSHGLRHEYASDRYELFTGSPSPIRGGGGRSVAGDLAARLRVAQELGHGRHSITNSYYGSSANPPRASVPSPEVGDA